MICEALVVEISGIKSNDHVAGSALKYCENADCCRYNSLAMCAEQALQINRLLVPNIGTIDL